MVFFCCLIKQIILAKYCHVYNDKGKRKFWQVFGLYIYIYLQKPCTLRFAEMLNVFFITQVKFVSRNTISAFTFTLLHSFVFLDSNLRASWNSLVMMNSSVNSADHSIIVWFNGKANSAQQEAENVFVFRRVEFNIVICGRPVRQKNMNES